MPHIDFSCTKCRHFQRVPTNGHAAWFCTRYDKKIERDDPQRCVCRSWRPATSTFSPEVQAYFQDVAPGTLLNMRSRELYHIAPDCRLMALH